jgi:hypothetical protein
MSQSSNAAALVKVEKDQIFAGAWSLARPTALFISLFLMRAALFL